MFSLIFSFVTFIALMSFMFQRQHILMCLLSLEAALLSLAFIFGVMNSFSNFINMFFCIIILTLGACEAALALSILVNISRATGSDMIKSANMSKC